MKISIVTIALFLSIFSTRTMACSDSGIGLAEKALSNVETYESVGLATGLEVLFAKKNVLDLRLCQESQNGGLLDVSILADLGDIADKRIAYSKNRIEVGLEDKTQVIIIEAEKSGYSKACEKILVNSKARLEVGLITKSDYQNIENVCQKLKVN